MSDDPHDDDGSLQARAPDGYEAGYMKPSGRVLFREKSVAPWTWQLLFLLPVMLTFAAFFAPLAAGAPLLAALPGLAIGLATSGVLGLAWLLFAVLRVTVSTDEVYVQFGLFGPRIPVSSIESVEDIDYKWTEFGGWGIKRSFKDGTTIYNMWGDHGRAVKVGYRDSAGKLKKVAIGSASAALLADAIRQAVGSHAGNPARARIDAGVEDARVRVQAQAQQPAGDSVTVEAEGNTEERGDTNRTRR